jgi:AI-2 transport protein TqsA
MGFGLKTTTGIIAGVLVMAALAQASKVFAPLAAALFVIAIVWPVQKQVQSWMPKLAALAITIVATVAICLGFASLAAWGFGRVGRSLVGDLPRYQALYSAMVTWLDGHGISVAGCGPNTSMSAGCCARRSRLRPASIPRSASG